MNTVGVRPARSVSLVTRTSRRCSGATGSATPRKMPAVAATSPAPAAAGASGDDSGARGRAPKGSALRGHAGRELVTDCTPHLLREQRHRLLSDRADHPRLLTGGSAPQVAESRPATGRAESQHRPMPIMADLLATNRAPAELLSKESPRDGCRS